ncbi:branched-chain amino acid ABC transporter permease [Mesorhizobium sp. CO1-1-8]|uniref:branched-chain amino acid ABC transporter permease n=1 Tax=Mesorhizobium sp. CO1-1-8 TaxID=2876631 RepID=UPI001CD0640C|nr:branched-chain amino acid ABC transporter permease [Mesorhizobium sp. CO1-1-8]MBZ9772548.1 branched-chain amino acid ABC transporter permease [Mesorhizobium sp. CO1-1-8]
MDIVRRLGAGTFVTVAAGIAILLIVPRVFDLFNVLQITIFAVMAILALSLSLAWGLGGILCFGQAAFFGLGGYAYAVAVENMGDSTIPILLSFAVPALFALALGYFMFLGRLSELYVGVITLCVSLILFNFFSSTTDPSYKVGKAVLNGFNGMSNIPQINIPGYPNAVLDPNATFALVMASLILVYVICKLLSVSTYGRIITAVKQNEDRAELMGYNSAYIKLGIFVISAGIAGYAGCLFANWNAFISPGVFSLAMTAQTIIWIIVGGRETFIGPVLGAVGMQYLTTRLGTTETLDTNLVLGIILMGFVVLVPEGMVPFVSNGCLQLIGRLRSRPAAPNVAAIAARQQKDLST